VIETTRLVISELALGDIEEARVLHNEPETLKWLSDARVVSTSEQLKWFENLQKSSSSKRYIARAKANNSLIGVFRFDNFDRQNSSAMVGLDIAVQFRQLGFAREIYEALLPYFFATFSLHRLSLITLENNSPAIQLYEGLGFKQEGILREAVRRDKRFVNAIQYALLESDYEH
jgi:RimJ/RimL family protein N-acetyltransferase